MIALEYDNKRLEGDLVYAGNAILTEGSDLETAALMSLCCDARAQPTDELPAGAARRGYWADAFDDDGDVLGSRLWLLEDAVATAENARRAQSYALEALQWLIDDGHVVAIGIEPQVEIDAVWLGISFTLRNGDIVTLSPFKAF